MNRPTRSWLRRLPDALLALGLVTVLVLLAVPAQASEAADLQALARDWVDQNLAGEDDTATLRPEIEIGSLDTRLRLAPCQRVEPYLPRGSRLWGRSRIGLRCADSPGGWNVFLPITVKAWGPAWVVRQPVAPGATLSTDDAELTEVDWAEHPAPVLARQQDWLGKAAARALMPGTVLRQPLIRPTQVFAAGTQVKVVVVQGALRLAASGQAISHGFLGQSARVRLPNGKVLSGRVLPDNSIELQI
jgi:flagella basal body P-ring formation protein FlgA